MSYFKVVSCKILRSYHYYIIFKFGYTVFFPMYDKNRYKVGMNTWILNTIGVSPAWTNCCSSLMNNVNTSPRYLEGLNAIDYTQMPFPCENPVLQREQTKQIANILRFRNLINKNLYIQQLRCLVREISGNYLKMLRQNFLPRSHALNKTMQLNPMDFITEQTLVSYWRHFLPIKYWKIKPVL